MDEKNRLKELEDAVKHLIQLLQDREAFDEWESKISHHEMLKKEQEHKEAFVRFLMMCKVRGQGF